MYTKIMLHLNILHKCKKSSKVGQMLFLLKMGFGKMPEKQKARRIVEKKCRSVANPHNLLLFIALGCYTFVFKSVAKKKV